MKNFAEILQGKVRHIIKDWSLDWTPEFEAASGIMIVDITGKDEIQEGWNYNFETREFSAPPAEEPVV
jgi:hypothetical protein